MKSLTQRILSWLPALDRRVWILSFGRLLSQFGNGFTLFYAPIFFVNQVGLSATVVGIAIGSGSISGVVGRFVGGMSTDSQRWGRRRTLLVSAAISAVADVALAIAYDFPTLLLGNLLMGAGIGLYWPATEAVVADLTTGDERNEAFGLVRLADSIGLSLGVVLGGALIEATGAYRALFVIDGITYVLFFAIIYVAISETLASTDSDGHLLSGWRVVLGDRVLWIFVGVNVLFTTYLSQVQSTMPLYFSNFVSTGENGDGFSASTISALFTWHVGLTALLQLPIARWLNRFGRPTALTFSALLWGIGFLLIAATGIVVNLPILWAALALGVLAIATVTYLPSASAFVVDLAPDSLRGIYLSINSQCWAIGYFIGPPLGGWALDQSSWVAHSFWIGLSLSVILAIVILRILNQSGSRFNKSQDNS